MARIAGVNIPTNKRVLIGLQYIHGIGPAKSREIITKVGIPDQRRVFQLTDQDFSQSWMLILSQEDRNGKLHCPPRCREEADDSSCSKMP